MRIPQSVIDQVLARTDLTEVIGARVRLKKSGQSYSGCCPFHKEKTPSFYVMPDKGFYHCFGCQASGNAIRFLMAYENRSFMEILQELAQRANVILPRDNTPAPTLTYTRGRAIQPAPGAVPATQSQGSSDQAKAPIAHPAAHLAASTRTQAAADSVHDQPDSLLVKAAANEAANQPQIGQQPAEPPSAEWQDGPSASWTDADSADVIASTGATFEVIAQTSATQPIAEETALEGDLYGLLEQICGYFQQQLARSATAQHYLQQRGVSTASCEQWRIGYAPEDWQHLLHAFPHDHEGLRLLQMIRQPEHRQNWYCLLRHRVIFPIRDTRGRVVGFGGRALADDVKPKYINSPESPVFHKSHLLYGFHESRQARARQWVMTEGYLDVIALHQAGLPGAVAALGTATSTSHLQMLFQASKDITLAFDGDTAGQQAAWRSMQLALPLMSDGRSLRFLVLPDGHDPDSLIRQEGLQAFSQRLQVAPVLSDFLFTRLTSQADLTRPEGKAQVMHELRQLTSQLPNGSFTHQLRRFFYDRLNTRPDKRTRPVGGADPELKSTGSIEGKAIALLLMYPQHAALYQDLLAMLPPDHVLQQLYQLVSASQRQTQGDDFDADQTFFLLGAVRQDELRANLIDLIEKSEEFTRIDNVSALMATTILQFQLHWLGQRLKAPALDLRQTMQFRKQYDAVARALNFGQMEQLQWAAS